MTNVKFENGNATRGTVWLELTGLRVDQRYQRPLIQPRVNKIAAEFDPEMFGVLHVSRRPDGSHYVVDGQHRTEAARQFLGANANGQRVECKVYEGLTLQQEARLFRRLNDQTAQTMYAKFRASVQAGDPVETAVNRIVEGLGLTVGQASRDRCVTAVGALTQVYRGFSRNAEDKHPELLRMVLSIINSAWGATGDSLNGHIIEGLGRLLLVRQRVLDIPDLIKRLAQYPGGPLGLLGKARGRREIMGGKIGHNVAEAIIEAYNRGRRNTAVEGLR